MVYFRTDIYAPQMVLKKTVTDVNGGDVNPGDVLHYDISSTNTGQSSAYDSRINDVIPPHTAFQPGSLKIDSSPAGIAGGKTDPTDRDQAEYDGAARTRCASASARARPAERRAGQIPRRRRHHRPGRVVQRAASTSSSAPTRPTARRSSTPRSSRARTTHGIDYTSIASAPAAVTVRGVPDVTIDKSHTGTFVRGQQGTFTLLVSNVGGRPTSGTVVIDDTLPNGLASSAPPAPTGPARSTRPPTRCTASAPMRSPSALPTNP